MVERQELNAAVDCGFPSFSIEARDRDRRRTDLTQMRFRIRGSDLRRWVSNECASRSLLLSANLG